MEEGEGESFTEETKKFSKPVSTSKAELSVPLLESEDTHYFSQVTDVVWED